MSEEFSTRSPQALQEAEYSFPYHYVATWQPGFSQCFYDDWGIHYVSTIEYILGRLRKMAPASIIDVGCGDGRLTREVALDLHDVRVVGIDYSARAIALAKALNADLQAVEFSDLDITAPHHQPQSQVALLVEVLEHIPPEQVDDFINGVRRLLEPGGTLLLTVPHVNQPLEPKHYRHFTSETIRESLSGHFSVEEIVPFERMGLRCRILRFLLGNKLFILNNRYLRDRLYQVYKQHLFDVDCEANCRRLFVRAVAK